VIDRFFGEVLPEEEAEAGESADNGTSVQSK
jgi:hypothetical protein